MISDELHNLASAFAGHTLVETDAFHAVLHAGDLETARSLLHHLLGILMQGEVLRAAIYTQLRADLERVSCEINAINPPPGLQISGPREPLKAPKLSDFPKVLDL